MSVDEEHDAAIAAVEPRLSALGSEREAAARELAELRTRRERATSDASGEINASPMAWWTPERKLALFASLFQGREDVFPVRWEKPAKDKSGWAPCCGNEWKAGVCGTG